MIIVCVIVDHTTNLGCVWNKVPDNIRTEVPDMAFAISEVSPRELALRFTDIMSYFVLKKFDIRAAKDP